VVAIVEGRVWLRRRTGQIYSDITDGESRISKSMMMSWIGLDSARVYWENITCRCCATIDVEASKRRGGTDDPGLHIRNPPATPPADPSPTAASATLRLPPTSLRVSVLFLGSFPSAAS
jgi:hypothetical protein